MWGLSKAGASIHLFGQNNIGMAALGRPMPHKNWETCRAVLIALHRFGLGITAPGLDCHQQIDLPGPSQRLAPFVSKDTVAMLTDKIREDRIRRRLDKIGYRLCKTPARSWLRAEYGPGYMIVDHTNTVRLGCGGREYQATLADAEAFAFNR